MSDARQASAGPDLSQSIGHMGARFDEGIFRQTSELYAPLHHAPSEPEVIRREEVYGPHERHRMDVFLPDEPHAPLVLFVPGGGFVGGDKRVGGPFYSNVGRFFAQHGFIAAVINYRLAPAAPWPAGGEDLDRAVAWLSSHAGHPGARPEQIFVVGQSAGATHVASWLATASQRRISIRAAALLSGFYHLHGNLTPGQAAYFGTDASTFEDRSPVGDIAHWSVPLLLTVAEYDPPATVVQSLELARSITVDSARMPDFVRFAGHNHVSTVMSLGTADRQVGDVLLEFFTAHRSTA
jgi:acetyl esterase/lipase